MSELSYNPHGSVHVESADIVISASAQKVWETVSDIERMPGLNPLMLSAEWLDGATEASMSARFNSMNLHDELGVWSATSRIVEYAPCRAIAWTIESDSAPAAVCRFDILEEANHTILRQTYFIDPRPGAEPPVGQALRPCR